MIAALFVEPGGCYFGLPNVDPWDIRRDARKYRGPYSVVAHPECQRWGRFATGSTAKPNQYRVGEDCGCCACAITSIRNYGGVGEHPKDSLAWDYFGLQKPGAEGWTRADSYGGYTCQVEQGWYGHFSRKPTWLYAVVDNPATLPILRWGRAPQRIHPRALEKHGYAKARRIGMMAMVGGKDKTASTTAVTDVRSRRRRDGICAGALRLLNAWMATTDTTYRLNTGHVVSGPDSRAAAQAELDFLRSLLPEGER